MKQFRILRWVGLSAASLLILPALASASPILNGTFDLAGTFSVTGFVPGNIHWQSNTTPAVPNQATVGTSDLSGTFTALAPGGEPVSVADLNNPPESVGGSGFGSFPFVTFLMQPTWPVLEINFIAPAPTFNPSNNCPGGTPAVGQSCTLPGSPFSLLNVSGTPGHPIGTQVGFVLDGVTSDGLSMWTANYTAQFNVPFQTLLGQIGSGATVTNTYSATFTVVATPEPSSLYFIVGSLALLLGYVRLRKQRFGRL